MTGTFKPDPDYGEPLASKESNAFAADRDLDKEAVQAEHNRHQAFQNHANMAAIAILWTVAGLTLTGMFAFAINLMLPADAQWLTVPAQEKIQTLLAAALLSSAMTTYVNKRMS